MNCMNYTQSKHIHVTHHLNQITKYTQHPKHHLTFLSLTSNNEHKILVEFAGNKYEIQRDNPRSHNYWTWYINSGEHGSLVSCPSVIWPMATCFPTLFSWKYLFYKNKKTYELESS